MKNILKYTVLTVLAAVLFGCAKEPGGGQEQTQEFRISFRAEDMAEVSTSRSGGGQLDFSLGRETTRIDPNDQDTENINDIWVLQFIDGRLAARPYHSYGSLNAEVIDGYNVYTATVQLVANSVKTSDIYVVANTDDRYLFPTDHLYVNYTQTEFLEKLHDITTEWDVLNYKNTMVGSEQLKLGSTAQPHIILTRMFARLRLSLTIPDGSLKSKFNFTSVQVKSVPKFAIYSGLTGGGKYPEALSSNFIDYDTYSPDPASGEAIVDEQLVWHVPENLRGENLSIGSDQTKKTAANDPDFVDGRSLSTHLVLQGTYVDDLNATSLVTITLYPGANTTTDFNVKRNTTYDMMATINTFDAAADDRIELDAGPFVTFIYSYELYYPGYGTYQYYRTDYVSGYTSGNPISPDGTILNKYKDIIDQYYTPYYYTLSDGQVASGSATVVDNDNANNVVYIRYSLLNP